MNTKGFRRLPLRGTTGEDRGLQKLGDEAEAFLRGFGWCPPAFSLCVAYGIAGVIGLFLAEFEPPVQGSDRYLWVVVGDLPSAYFVTDDARDARSALTVYCSLMQNWVDAVREGGQLDKIFPVAAEANEANADLLQGRLDFLTIKVIPTL